MRYIKTRLIPSGLVKGLCMTKIPIVIAIAAAVIALGVFAFVTDAPAMMGSDAETCANCHVWMPLTRTGITPRMKNGQNAWIATCPTRMFSPIISRRARQAFTTYMCSAPGKRL